MQLYSPNQIDARAGPASENRRKICYALDTEAGSNVKLQGIARLRRTRLNPYEECLLKIGGIA